ncbi:calmodulin-binding transcription activator 1 isoform X2 [Daktulosphaira vitifoliae]|uniref:calmodulin-binding transcription activator 1 isoform X2 n=1 Tax=Daktulosphaira vitifoliae TaxID=58002 RepID=UPI0021A9B2D7|nr:calmodulin-binding transcription activator 1 isoform X2 [Daktulosphaira vitifoliae]
MSRARHETFTAEYCSGETVTLYSQQHHARTNLQAHANISNVPLNQKGEPIKLPDNLESLPRAENFPIQRHRWNTNEEIAAILINFEKHNEWQSKEVKIRPKSGSMLLYSRKKVRYRRDGYCWKKRKDGKTTREDHMKLKVQGTECIYGCYVHSAILPTFHRRCYWLLQNPDMVLVHYLNVPYPDDNKLSVISPNSALWADRKEWTKDELLSQLKPMFYEENSNFNSDIEVKTGDCVSTMVTQLMEWQKNARASLLSRTLECGCPDSTCADGQSCSRPIRRILSSDSNQVSSTTGNRTRPSTIVFTNSPSHQSRVNLTTTQCGLSSSNILNDNLIPNSTQEFHNQVQQQIIMKYDCRESGSFMNNRHLSQNNTPENSRTNDDILHGYNNKEIYQGPENQNDHIINIYQNHNNLKQQIEDHVKSEFYDVTLDLSHDDIQKTLSVNMPAVTCANSDQLLRLDDNRNNKNVTGDDVFVNLDAFDMLTDFQELDILENTDHQTSTSLVTGMSTNAECSQNSIGHIQMDIDVLQITDYSPGWAFPEGGVKILVTGPWYSSSSYTVMFDSVEVSTTLIQEGVLRCYCPAHDIGTVTLQVIVDGRPISSTAIFEYRQREFPLTISSLTVTDTSSLLKFYLLQKLDLLEEYLQPISQQSHLLLKENLDLFNKSNFEERLVDYCEHIKQFSWKPESECNIKQLDTETTILHMAAFLGYSKLVCKLLQWKLEKVSQFLEMEINVSKQDCEGYTPLMWACKKGHKDTAVLLCQWNQTVQNSNSIMNSDYFQTEILESVHQYFNDFNHNQYYTCDKLTDDIFTKPNEFISEIKKENSFHKFDVPSSQTAQLNHYDLSLKENTDNQCDQNNKKHYLNFSQTNDHYKRVLKSLQHCPSIQKFQKSDTLPLQSPSSDSGISIERSPILKKSNFIIWEQDFRVLTLAEQFIAAMPEHIKNENKSCGSISNPFLFEVVEDPASSISSCCFELKSAHNECNDEVYRQHERESETPSSSTSISLSPMSSISQYSPSSPPPSAQDLCEFLHASSNNQFFENNFSKITLSAIEQRELYDAAKTIQKAYRTYKKREEHKEMIAASVIQTCYRRYKQFAYYKQMNRAAIVIQKQFRSYRRNKRCKKDISRYSNNPSTTIKKSQTQKRHNQAARKIQNFMKHNKNNMSPPIIFNERNFINRKRDAGSQPNNVYPPTKVSQYSTVQQSSS